MRRTTNTRTMLPVSVLLLLTWIVTGSSMPAHALCGGGSATAIPTCNQLISAGNSYVVTPGCEDLGCGSDSISVTDALVGQFWGLGEGDPAHGLGSDNGTFPALGGWLYTYPGYPAFLTTTWGVDSRIDDCFTIAHTRPCTVVLLMDRATGETGGFFALLTAEANNQGNYDFSQPGNINLARIPAPLITRTAPVSVCGDTSNSCTSDTECPAGVSCNADDAIEVVFLMPAASTIEGLYLDPECGDADSIVLGYQLFQQVLDQNSLPPDDPAIEAWTPISDVVPLGDPIHTVVDCPNGPAETNTAVYVAAGLVFESGFETVYLSSSATRVECGANLADPDSLHPRKPRKRTLPRRSSLN